MFRILKFWAGDRMQGTQAVRTVHSKRAGYRLLQTTSLVALALTMNATPARAQLAALRASLGVAPVVVTPANAVPMRPVGMREVLARSVEHQALANNMRGAILEAQKAAIAAIRNPTLAAVRDGLTGADGSNAGAGLDPVRTGTVTALDPTGVNTWQGARLPTQVDKDGKPLVTIVQSDSRAILSWNRFDVGANTTLNFEQKLNGVAQPGWVALNRVANSVAPSRVLGSITADGTVAVINSRGVVFEKGSQVNLHSLLVSSLDIGGFTTRKLIDPTDVNSSLADAVATIADRNLTFLASGLQSSVAVDGKPIYLVSSVLNAVDNFTNIPSEGGITIDRGATVNAIGGGFIIATAPSVSNAGILSAPEGQVSLQAGRAIAYAVSTGAATTTDIVTGIGPDVRGLVLRSWFGLDGAVANSGLVHVPRGYISLGTGEGGTVTNLGLLASTTSVARNAKISLTGETILLGDKTNASGIVVTPDTNGETVPIGTSLAPPAFKSTKIEIGNIYLSRGRFDESNPSQLAASFFGPAAVKFDEKSLLLAPNADLVVGGKGFIEPNLTQPIYQPLSLGNIDVLAGAVIDVGGVKDLQIDPSRNSLMIDPLKRNELRDSPTYREVTTNGDFTLNGATVYVDPRLSGVRNDGVAWVGSPLIEAGSAASQIPVTAAELMTRGGTVSLTVATATTQLTNASLGNVTPVQAPTINISKGSVIDFSGGWLRFGDGFVRSSKLLTSDGRIVEIGRADPNDNYIAVGDGFTEIQAKFGVSRTFANSLLQGGRLEVGYDEGRDAGSLSLTATTMNIEGLLDGRAFAGVRQSAGGMRGTRDSAIAGDPRKLQATASQLSSSGALIVSAGRRDATANEASYGADIIVYHGDRSAVARPLSEILLSDAALLGAGLSGLSLYSSGKVTFGADTDVRLANGGALSVIAGRTITLDGKITVPSGAIAAAIAGRAGGAGSAFRTEPVPSLTNPPRLADIIVGATVSAAGLWVNDFGKFAGETTGAGYADGGSVSLTTLGAIASNSSLVIADQALLDVSSGGYVNSIGRLQLTARGGNISLINRTSYATPVVRSLTNGSAATIYPVATSPYTVSGERIPTQVLPDDPTSEVRFSAKSLTGFGFAGGGTFTLVAPNLAMGSDVTTGGAGVGLDFLKTTGFATLDLSVNDSKVVKNLFSGVVGSSYFAQTSLYRVAANDTLDLTQWVRSPLVDAATAARLTALQTGGDLSFITPVKPADPFDQRAANLRLGGLTELDVEAGGAIVGAAGAAINVSKLLNAGTIRIAGGSIIQNFSPEQAARATRFGFGIRDAALGGNGLREILGGATGDGPYSESTLTSAILFGDVARTTRLTNKDVFASQYFNKNVYILGRLDADEGIRFAAGSVTDLSGTALINPRPPLLPTGLAQVTGRVIAGGTIAAGAVILTREPSGSPLSVDTLSTQTLNALPGSTINLRGASASFDVADSPATYARTLQWSNGGRLSLLSGGTLGGSAITAQGGAPLAEGGTLEWLDPVMRQTDTGVRADNVLFSSQIGASGAGFDTLLAFNGFTVDGIGGAVSLTLGKLFDLQTSGPAVIAAAGASFTVNAPFIRLARTNDVINAVTRTMPLGAGIGTLEFNAFRNLDLVGRLSFSDPLASASRSSVTFRSKGDIRLIGTQTEFNGVAAPGLVGGIASNGDMIFSAGQIYATTGTGNAQADYELPVFKTDSQGQKRRTNVSTPFAITSSADDGLITFLAEPGATASDAYSAGAAITVRAAKIVQGGMLRAPLGKLSLGSNFSDAAAPATQSLDFLSGSVTSVSGAGKTVPYGITTDLTSYLFSPNVTDDLTAPPVGQLDLSGGTINVAAGATVDGRGGGEIFAYEFVSGTGGSRDVLDRFNPDSFSGNAGFQYADKRQVYAILPKDQTDRIAKFDAVYSADYQGADGRNLYGDAAGRAITIDASPGLAAGEYILLPAHYALIPGLGALRVVENVGALPPVSGTATTLRDGSVVVGGTYTTAGLNLAESQRRSFTLQSNDTFRRSSRIETALGTAQFVALAAKQNRVVPRLPIDAARTILSPLTELKIAGLFQTGAASGGRGAQFDIGAKNINITGATGGLTDPIVAVPGVLTLTTATLANLNASSLFIGGQRTDNEDGTTTLGVLADTINIDGKVNFTAPELIFAVAGLRSSLIMRDGAVLTATGSTGDARRGDYIIESDQTPLVGNLFDLSGIGAVLRVAGETERLVQRQGDFALRNTLRPSLLTIGAATINGGALTLDASRTFRIDELAVLNAANIAVSSDALHFGNNFIEAGVEATLAKAARLTLRSRDTVRFSAATPHIFNDLRLDTPGLSFVPLTGPATLTPSTLTIDAKNLTLGNSSKALADCTRGGFLACGRAGNSLVLNANSVSFGAGTFRTYGFDKAVTLNATNGMFVEGAGIFDVTAPAASLALNTPFVIDRTASDLRNGYSRPDYRFLTDAAFTMTAPVGVVPLPLGQEAPGAKIAIGSNDAPVASASIGNVYLRATSGIIDVRSSGSITLSGATTLATPGYAKTFGDAGDPVVISANAGTISLISTAGGIDAASTASFIVDNGTGEAGALNLIATRGTINLAATLNPGLTAGTKRTASLTVDAARLTNGSALFDFAAFVAQSGPAFGGDLAIRTGTGNLTMNAGQNLRARSVLLTADDTAIGQGLITIAGTIDTSGDEVTALNPSDPRYNAARVDGGNIALYGNGGVTLGATGKLVATTAGYSALDSRVASAGNVTLGSGRVSTAADPVTVTLATGSQIDVRALRPGHRLVSQFSKDPATGAEITTYRYAESDKGGAVTLRAQIGAGNTVDIRNSASISGALSLEIEAFKRFDLQVIGKSGSFSGISANGVRLNAAATGKPNFLADFAPGTLPHFVRKFSVTAVNGQSFGAFTTRPGIELVSNKDIILGSILNLGAGKIVDYAGAVAAGLLELSPLGPDTSGKPRYQVVPNAPGKAFENETQLFNRFVDMTYRVGGLVSGAAPVLTIRAAGDLDVANSITDGFFAFHDRSNADYISYQLGGGNRSYNPALTLNCGAADNCANAAPYITGLKPVGSDINRISIGRAVQGDDVAPFTNSPYSDSVNRVSAVGTGDPLGVAELFPLVNGGAAKSSSIRLVGGSGMISVNPLHTDTATPGSVLVSGERSYQIERAVAGTTLKLAGGLQLRQPVASAPTDLFDVDRYFIEKYQDEEARDKARNSYTILSWGGGSTADANDTRAAARRFFTGGQEFTVFGKVQTGIIARLEDVVAFLASSIFAGGKTYAENVVAGTPGYDAAPLARIAARVNGTSVYPSLTSSDIYTSTTVRTGNGEIAIAASADVDTLRAQNVRYRNRGGGTSTINFVSENPQQGNALIGSNAIYTAGSRADKSLPIGLAAPLGQQERLDDRLERENVGATSFAGIASGVKPISPVFANNGGNISIVAGRDVIGRRDVWSNRFGPDYRIGQVGLSTQVVSAPEYFTSGIGTLAGGNVSIRSGGVIRDLTVALANNVFTTDFDGAGTLVSLGSGNLAMNVGTDLLGGRLNVASGAAVIKVDGSVIAAGVVGRPTSQFGNQITINDDRRNLLNLRLSDATFKIAATGTVDIGGISAFGVRYDLTKNDFGFFTPVSSLSVAGNETITYVPNEISQRYALNFSKNGIGVGGNPVILPGSLQLGSLTGDLRLGTTVISDTGAFQLSEQKFLYPSIYGQLGLYAGRNIPDLKLTMLDANPADLPGAFSVFRTSPSTGAILSGVDFQLIRDGAGDATARLDHNRRITHLGDDTPARIFADGSIRNAYIVLPKQARISASVDIVDSTYRGQNLTPRDVTRITAGNDITATRATAIFVNPALTLPFNAGNDIAVGGPGALFVEAGRNLGPFIVSGNGLSGGIRTVGNDANPWLSGSGAKLYAMFGLKSPTTGSGSGANYDALIQSYLNPVNLPNVDGDLFERNVDSDGNATPDSSRYVYAPILAQWLHDNEPALFDRVFGNPALREAAGATGGATLAEATRLAADSSLSAAGKTAAAKKLTAAQTLATAAYPKMGDLYAEFASLSAGTPSDPGLGVLRQRQFLLDKLYFGELQAPADPTGNSYLQYVRSYRAIDTLFPAARGYTDNLATYTRDPTTISAINPLGVLVKKLDASGQALVATKVKTGDADLRLSAFQTTRGGDITLIGPGGDIIAGSVVRLDAQLARTAQGDPELAQGSRATAAAKISPSTFSIGNEGVLTLRTGGIRSFTDGDFRLNQSRLFAVRGGDLVLFSANGDLNAGQGPKTSSSFPPIKLRFDPNGLAEVDSAGSVAGAGIATFRPSPEIAASSVTLVAPVGTVDAGDAGVRASGNVFVAAARVANADNFKVGGAAFGVPTIGTTTASLPAGASSVINTNTFRPKTLGEQINDRLSQILVNVLGYFGGENPCPEGQVQNAAGECQPK